MAFMFISGIVSYIVSTIFEVKYCFDMEAHVNSKKSDRALVCFVSCFIFGTVLIALCLVLRLLHVL